MPRKDPNAKLTAGQALDKALQGTAEVKKAKEPGKRRRKNVATKPPEERSDYPTAQQDAKKARNEKSNAVHNPKNNDAKKRLTAKALKAAAAEGIDAAATAAIADGAFKERKGMQRGFASIEAYMDPEDNQRLADILTSTSETREPGEWVWDKQKLAAADALADGHSIKEVALALGIGRTTMYEWLHHGSGKMQKYMDAVTQNMSIANKRIRITRLVRMADKLFKVAEAKFERLLDHEAAAEKIDAETLKSIMSEYREFSMLIAKEKMELVEVIQSNNTNANIELKGAEEVEAYLDTFSDTERQQLLAKFNGVADQVIARYKG